MYDKPAQNIIKLKEIRRDRYENQSKVQNSNGIFKQKIKQGADFVVKSAPCFLCRKAAFYSLVGKCSYRLYAFYCSDLGIDHTVPAAFRTH